MAKIAIIGAGFVGSTTAFALMVSGASREIVLIDKIKEKAHGEAMDLKHCASFVKPVDIYAGTYEDCNEADIVIITAGAPQVPGQSRLELVETNTTIMQSILEQVLTYCEHPILLVVTNPVDLMSYLTRQISGLPPSRVIGSGTVLDTSRFRHLLSVRCGLDPRNVHAYVVGEHGDSEVPLWSSANIAGVTLDHYCRYCDKACTEENREEISQQVREAAYEIIEGKGATYFAISLALTRIVESIVRDENSIMTVSTEVYGLYGLNDIYLSLPCILGKTGVQRIVPVELNSRESDALHKSAQILKSYLPGKARETARQL